MVINLNDKKFDVVNHITREQILSEVTEEDIFKYYWSGFKVGRVDHAPYREDKSPSFGVFYARNASKLMFKDLAKGDSGDVFGFVKKFYPNISDQEILHQISNDLNLDISSDKPINTPRLNYNNNLIKKKYEYTYFHLGVKYRRYRVYDSNFWRPYGIKLSTLKKFKVLPIEYIFMQNYTIKADKHAYVYIEFKDGKTTYKIYQPYSDKFKWLTNHDSSVHQGYNQLPKTGELLIITKSLKDVMSIHDVANYPAVAIQAESVTIKDSVMDEYKQRFAEVICLFDNDEQGIKWSSKFEELYGIRSIVIPKGYQSKDFSDLVKGYNKDLARKVLNELIIF